MKKLTLLTFLFVLTKFSVMAETITYNDPKEIIEQTQRNIRHK